MAGGGRKKSLHQDTERIRRLSFEKCVEFCIEVGEKVQQLPLNYINLYFINTLLTGSG